MANISFASSSIPVVIITSKNIFANSLAVFLSISRFNATIPPKLLIGSQFNALVKASQIFTPIAAPHGFACLTTHAKGSVNSLAILYAASPSFKLL